MTGSSTPSFISKCFDKFVATRVSPKAVGQGPATQKERKIRGLSGKRGSREVLSHVGKVT